MSLRSCDGRLDQLENGTFQCGDVPVIPIMGAFKTDDWDIDPCNLTLSLAYVTLEEDKTLAWSSRTPAGGLGPMEVHVTAVTNLDSGALTPGKVEFT